MGCMGTELGTLREVIPHWPRMGSRLLASHGPGSRC